MTTFLDVKKCGEGMVNAIKCDGLSFNPDLVETITKSKNKHVDEEILKEIFNERRHWEKNLKKRTAIIKEVM
jgi:hypothetical protein